VHLTLHKKSQLYLNKYPEHILNYAIEWERVISTRITTYLKQSEKLRVDLDHYQSKVEDLNKDANRTMNRGKNVNDREIEKLKRNEGKFVQARQDYDKFVNDLCGYMEEVLDRGYKDLHPMLVKMAQFDSTYSQEEANVLKSIGGVTRELMGFGTKNDLSPTGRLKELETASLVSLINKYHPSGTTLAIMGGEASASSSADEMNVGGGGLFGSVRMNNSNEDFGSLQGSRNNSSEGFTPRSRNDTGDSDWSRSHSRGPTPSAELSYTSNMLTVQQASAPPPTLDDIFGSSSANTVGMQSTSMQKSYSGNFAPPAGMPPPPPSMPPPLPPQSQFSGLSMYDNPHSQMPPMAPPPPATGYHSAPNSGGLFSPATSQGSGMMSSGGGSTNPFEDGHGGNGSVASNYTGSVQQGFGSPTNPFG
jgi:hypothetical protein